MTLTYPLIGIAALIAIGILLHHPSKSLGIPSLLIFMGVGLVFGNGEFDFVYDDLKLTSQIGGIALNIIVFTGGLNTSTDDIKNAWKEGGILATLGVVITSLISAAIIYQFFELNFLTCLLFAAVVSSTDAAAVFSILKSKKLKLKENADTILEFESATNDPVALVMVIMLTAILVSSDGALPSPTEISSLLTQQVLVGTLLGTLVASLGVFALNRIKLEEFGLIPVFILACFIIATYGSELLGGNILIASYIAGVIFGNHLERGREVNKHFYNALSWLAQSLMFVVLGLQIFPAQLPVVFYTAIGCAIVLTFVARPIAVMLCYLPFTKSSLKKRLFISAIGLKGATPIVFALIPAAAGVEHADKVVYVVFFIVLFSILVQGGVLEPLAKKLQLNIDDSEETKGTE